jgi:hypothetical protein
MRYHNLLASLAGLSGVPMLKGELFPSASPIANMTLGDEPDCRERDPEEALIESLIESLTDGLVSSAAEVLRAVLLAAVGVRFILLIFPGFNTVLFNVSLPL